MGRILVWDYYVELWFYYLIWRLIGLCLPIFSYKKGNTSYWLLSHIAEVPFWRLALCVLFMQILRDGWAESLSERWSSWCRWLWIIDLPFLWRKMYWTFAFFYNFLEVCLVFYRNLFHRLSSNLSCSLFAVHGSCIQGNGAPHVNSKGLPFCGRGCQKVLCWWSDVNAFLLQTIWLVTFSTYTALPMNLICCFLLKSHKWPLVDLMRFSAICFSWSRF